MAFLLCRGLAQARSEALWSEEAVVGEGKAASSNHGPRSSLSCGGGVCSANFAAMDVGTIRFCPRHILEYVLAWCNIVNTCVLGENTLLTRRNGKKPHVLTTASGFGAGESLTDLVAPRNCAAAGAVPH